VALAFPIGIAVSARYTVRSLLPSISITLSGSVPEATSPTTNRQSDVHRFANFDPLSHNSTAMSSNTEADVRDLQRAQRMVIIFSPITSTPRFNVSVGQFCVGNMSR